ncbi:lipocalin family protein [Salegentibacter sp. Hel_I_6]|uniref:lipocalin family protein n=1 Tax=Salegentibacter sp. Hel_I_6 TaxID=1250278 RepID=UPI000562FF09|nr:lipocalin family protein [Salegentibacter sp. Hel_I_6]
MKKITCFFTLFILLFTSCSTSDDDNIEESENEILGKWFYVAESYDEQQITHPENCFTQQYYEFFSNGSVSVKLYSEPCEDGENYTGDYAISGNTLEITGLQGSDDLNYSFSIVTLNNTTLIIEDEVSIDGVNETYRLELNKE